MTQNMEITGIAETHWRTTGHFTSTNNNLIISSGNEYQSCNGVAKVINKGIKHAVTYYEAVDDRILAVKIQTTPVHLNIIQVYAPTSASAQEEIENFYKKLTNTIRKTPNREILIILGDDFNTKIGNTDIRILLISAP